MERRRLGRTGLDASVIGYGAWGIGRDAWVGGDDQSSLSALHRAVDLGLTFVDTALSYGDGHSERLVGQLAREREERIVVATKVPPKNELWPAPPGLDPEEVFPADHVLACAERSRANLGVDTIDVLQLHVWSEEWTDRGSWREAVAQLKDDGRIRAFGVSINDHQPRSALALIETGVVDTVQVIYNVFEQSPADELLPVCRERDIGVIVRVPFDEGGLTGTVRPDTTFPEGDFRHEYFAGERKREVWERVQAIAADLDVPVERVPELALRFVISDPAVSTVIPGMRSVRNVERNMAAGDAGPLPPDQRERLSRHRWVRNFYA